MAIDNFISTDFPISCRGRNATGNEALDKPVMVTVNVYQSPGVETMISTTVKGCPHNTGSHGQHCKASNLDKVGKGVSCPFARDLC